MKKLKCRLINFLGLLLITSTLGLGQSISLSLASASSISGGSVVLPLSLISASGAQTAAVQWSFQYSSDITGVTVALGSASSTAQKSLTCNGNTCVVEGLNGTVIPDGQIATATFHVAANPSSATIPIQVLGIVAATPAADAVVAASAGSGTVTLPSSPVVSTLACVPATVNAPGSAACTVTLTSAAMAGAGTVPLSSNNLNLTVPATVTVTVGQSSATFSATAAAITTDQTAAITAGSGSLAKVATLNLVAPVLLSAVVCAPANLTSNTASTCTASLNKAATAAAVLAITSNNTVVSVPANVTIAIGQSSTTFQASAGTVTAGQTAIISASWSGLSKSANLTLGPLAAGVPSVVSATPNAASGFTQVFSFVFADTQSAANLSGTAILFAASQVFPNSCMAIYDKSQGSIQLQWDGALGATAKPISSAVVLTNSQCSIGATSLVTSGLTTTLTMNVTFTSSFAGLKNIYMYASDNGGAASTGWVQKGTYAVSVPSGPTPTVVSATPSAASGITQTFTFVYSDNRSVNLSGASVLFAASLAFPNSCMVIYDANQGSVQLEWDSYQGANSKPIASSTVLQNSQCSVGTTSVVADDGLITLTMAITFKTAFSGVKNIYMYGADISGVNTGWVQKGTFSVTGAPVPSVISVTPNAGTGSSQTFSFVFGDSQSAANLSGAAILFAPSLVFANSCMVIYDKNAGTVQLEWDSAQGSSSKAIASSTVIDNSQCSIAATSLVSSGLTTTLTMTITFKGAASGLKNIYMYGADNAGSINTGWVLAGTFNYGSGIPVPSVVSVTPNAGSGPAQTFSFVFADSMSATNLTGAVMLFNTSALSNSCMVIFDRTQGTLQLEWDNVNGSDSKPVGSSAPIQNSQCSIGANSVVSSGLTTTITLAVTFKPIFTSMKTISMFGTDTGGNTNTGWISKGTWTAF